MSKFRKIPAFIIAGAASGSGKTLVTLGILEALRRRGLVVQAFKAGPDYIDPGLHSALLGRPSYTLDTWMMGRDGVRATFNRAVEGADCAVIEGVMGLYDGRGFCEEGSTAHLSKILGVPVVLVANAEKAARSMGAVVLGFEAYDPKVDLRWAIFNRVGSQRHAEMLESSIRKGSKVRLLGSISRDKSLRMDERHLGLVTDSVQMIKETASMAAEAIERSIDINALLKGSLVRVRVPNGPAQVKEKVRVAVARDKAFSFYYRENLDILEGLGAKLAFFSPLKDESLPKNVSAIYLGGGYPEIYAAKLQRNNRLRSEIKRLAMEGMPVYAECGGLMYLGRALERNRKRFHMAGLFPWTTRLLDRRKALGYREVSLKRECPFLKKGTVRGHEFHYSEIISAPKNIKRAYKVEGAPCEGFTIKNTLASYVHLHFASNPAFAEGFVKAAKKYSSRGSR
ncbi:MAG TPA: cobyrinate a,c-diamide synthase [Thermodesulfobacteriota bacterium]